MENKKGCWDSDSEEENAIDVNVAVDIDDNNSTQGSVNHVNKKPKLVNVNEEAKCSVSTQFQKEDTLNLVPHGSTSISKLGLPQLTEVVEILLPNGNQQLSSPKIKSHAKHDSLFDGSRSSVDTYQRLNFIDQGTYGMVFRARCRETNQIYALKQIKLGSEANKVGFPVTALREINILLALQHPNIVRVKEMVVGSSIDKIYMVMEYCENDLKTCMKLSKQSFSTVEIKRLMLQLLRRLLVCDLGLARKYESPIDPYTFEVVTLWYRAPELLLGSKLYSTPIDMRSIGCIFAEMLTGDPLFPGEGELDQCNKIFRLIGAPNEERWPGVSALPNSSKVSWRAPTKGKLRDLFPVTAFSGGVCLNDGGFSLLSGLLNMDPQQRFSASEALKSIWLTSELPLPTALNRMPSFQSRDNELSLIL
eukprot:gene16415-22383_t